MTSDVQYWLVSDRKDVTKDAEKDRVLNCPDIKNKQIGQDALAIVKSLFYEHIANTPVLLDQIVRTYLLDKKRR